MPIQQFISFKDKYSYLERKTESNRILKKYPYKIPIICEKIKSENILNIKKNKFLVSRDLISGQFIFIIRKLININQETALFLFISNNIPPCSAYISDIYEEYKEPDGFLYISFSTENTFGFDNFDK